MKAGLTPYTIVRATQFFEFIGRIADSSTDGNTVRLSPALIRPKRPTTSPPLWPMSRSAHR